MKIRILILPKFDIGPLGNGICGEGELFYKEYARLYDEHDPKWMEMEDQTYTDPRLIDFFENSGCRDLSPYYVERRTRGNDR